MEAYKNKNQEKINRFTFGSINFYGICKEALKMAELKVFAIMLNALGFTAYCYALFISFFNVDVFTRSVLSLLGMVFMTVKIIDYIFTRRRKHVMENLDIRKKLNDEKERELQMRKDELDTYERENEIIKNFNLKK